tara:strand:- start:821 stop:1096 length:276 start_codon:yes stop_codon:yes gene_type:complete
MTAFVGLAVILGIGMGIGISYKYFKKREKKLHLQFEEQIEDKNSHYNHTLKSEGVKPKVIEPKKVEEVQQDKKEDSITDPASTPNVNGNKK